MSDDKLTDEEIKIQMALGKKKITFRFSYDTYRYLE
jgi:hypothetical protein